MTDSSRPSVAQSQATTGSSAAGQTDAISRREVLSGAVGLGGLATLGAAAGTVRAEATEGSEAAGPVDARDGQLKQSIVSWCFANFGQKWSIDKQIAVAKQLGCGSLELVAHKHLPRLAKEGLTCGLVPNGMPAPPFKTGWNNLNFHKPLIKHTREAIDAAAEHNCPNVIAFVGYRYHDPDDPASGEIPDDEALDNCIEGLKQVVGYAEKKGVTLCLENLNTRDKTSPFKGHPGYQGNHIDYCAKIVEGVGSDHMKLLFDLYHAQVMDGDLIRRVREHKDLIGHVHTAGNPGRVELGEGQEIRYRPIMETLAELGYEGFVGHEFIPTGDPLAGLKEAVRITTV